MAKIPLSIEIVTSQQRGLSSMGNKTRTAIQTILSKRYKHVGVTIVNDINDLNMLVSRRPDVVFLGMKFIPSQQGLGLAGSKKIWLSEFLDDAGIIYTGSGPRAIELELNKERAKQHLLDAGFATSRYMVVRMGEPLTLHEVTLTYPLFVKPTNRGGGSGVDAGSIVHTFEDLLVKVTELATKLQADALIEEYLPGREFTVSLLRQYATDNYRIMPLELIAPRNVSGARFLSGQIKSADTERHSAVRDGQLKKTINALAFNAFQAIGAQDYGRIDVRLDAGGVPHFLEANLLPSLLNEYGNFPKACQLEDNLSYESMILRIVDLAIDRRAAAYGAFDKDESANIGSPSFAPIS